MNEMLSAHGLETKFAAIDRSAVSASDIGGYASVFGEADQNGDIVGVGTLANGDQGAFLISSVVPIPAAVWLFASGLGLLGWLRRARPTAA